MKSLFLILFVILVIILLMALYNEQVRIFKEGDDIERVSDSLEELTINGYEKAAYAAA